MEFNVPQQYFAGEFIRNSKKYGRYVEPILTLKKYDEESYNSKALALAARLELFTHGYQLNLRHKKIPLEKLIGCALERLVKIFYNKISLSNSCVRKVFGRPLREETNHFNVTSIWKGLDKEERPLLSEEQLLDFYKNLHTELENVLDPGNDFLSFVESLQKFESVKYKVHQSEHPDKIISKIKKGMKEYYPGVQVPSKNPKIFDPDINIKNNNKKAAIEIKQGRPKIGYLKQLLKYYESGEYDQIFLTYPRHYKSELFDREEFTKDELIELINRKKSLVDVSLKEKREQRNKILGKLKEIDLTIEEEVVAIVCLESYYHKVPVLSNRSNEYAELLNLFSPKRFKSLKFEKRGFIEDYKLIKFSVEEQSLMDYLKGKADSGKFVLYGSSNVNLGEYVPSKQIKIGEEWVDVIEATLDPRVAFVQAIFRSKKMENHELLFDVDVDEKKVSPKYGNEKSPIKIYYTTDMKKMRGMKGPTYEPTIKEIDNRIGNGFVCVLSRDNFDEKLISYDKSLKIKEKFYVTTRAFLDTFGVYCIDKKRE